MKDINFFVNMLKFKDSNSNGIANKIVDKIRKAFEAELLEEQGKKVNFQHAQENALGCMAECFFCGARCSAIDSCDANNRYHKTNYHRPMAFKGTNEINKKDGRKRLVMDFCTSNFNLKQSRWDKPKNDKTPVHKLLERMSDEHNLEVEGMNVVL